MADSTEYFDLTIVTPDGTRDEFNVRHLLAPGTEGYFGVLRNHLPFITAIRTGEIEIDSADGKKLWAVSGGFVEVLGNRVIILAETAEPADQIDVERAKAALARAERRLKEKASGTDLQRCQSALQRSLNRLKIASNTR